MDFITIENKGQYCTLNSKTLEAGLDGFGSKRRFYKEFKALESGLDFKMWNAYTKLENHKMMRVFTKIGAVPYFINLEFDSIWFRKYIK